MRLETLPIHPAQRDVYTDQLINVHSPHYNVGGYIVLKGKLNKEKFIEVVSFAPQVFDVLKMRFDIDLSETDCYYDTDFKKAEIAELDFSVNKNPEEEAQRWMNERFNTAFPLGRESLLFEQFLIKISSTEYWFFGKYHHLIIDGYGFIVYVQYLAKKYQSLVAGEEVQFNYPGYKAESIKACAYNHSNEYKKDAAYWTNKIADKPEKLLQKKYQHPHQTSASYILTLSEAERKIIDEIQVKTKTGLQQLTIAAMLIYFGKTSNQSNLVFGLPVHKRSSRQLRNIVGMFAGILPFKGNYQHETKLAGLLKDITLSQKNDYRHHQYLIGDLIRHLKLNSADGYLSDIIINYELLNFDLFFGEDVKAEICRLATGHEKNPLQLCWHDYGALQPLQLHLHYRNEYFNQQEIEWLAQRIIHILKQFPASLNSNIESIEIIPESEHQLLSTFNATAAQYEPNKTIISLFEEQALKTPDNIAIVHDDVKLTYAELNRQANQLAHYLQSRGVTAETLVPICIERSEQMIVGILGILKAGGAYVPVDPEYPEERIQYMLEDSNAGIVVSSSQSKTKIPNASAYNVIEIDQEASIKEQPTVNPNTAISAHQLAYIIYTSGSTGKPKGVMIEHGNTYSFICWCKEEFDESRFQIVYAGTSMCFDLSVYEIFYPLSIGKPLRVIENGLHIGDYLPYDKEVLTNSVPAVVQSLLKEGTDLSNISVMNMAGEPIPAQVQQALDAEKIEIRNLYGPTEDTTYSTIFKLKNNQPILIGKPISNTQVYIVNKAYELVPVGVSGEICISGAGLAKGYLNREELTREKFIKNPFSTDPHARLYKTGDLGRWLADGNIEYQGRLDDQVKIRGYRIELGEIETVLQQCEQVSEAVVLARQEREGTKRLVGYVVPKGTFDREATINYLKARLPEFMVPHAWVEMQNFPLTSNGKIDKKALPDPDIEALVSNEYIAPRNETENILAEIWQEVLELERVGVNDNFFELGGHSLKAIQLVSRLHKRINIKIDIGKILSNPTIGELAQVLAFEKQTAFSSIKKLPVQVYYELSHAQKRIWILSHYKDGSTAYNSPVAYEIEGKLNVSAFRQAFDMLIERHETLRTVFIKVDNEPKQKILSVTELGFDIEALDISNDTNNGETIQKIIERDAITAFNLSRGPLLRASLLQVAGHKYVFVFNIHHIISDGWSKGILIKEFFSLYKDLIAGKENSLAPLPIQYKDYAAWHEASYNTQEKFWDDQFGKDVPVLNFPTDYERPKILSYQGEIIQSLLSKTVTTGLQKLATRYNTTLNNLMLSLYGLLVSKHSKQNDVVVGSLVSGRSHADLENLIGVFINFLPVRLSANPQLSLSEYIGNSHQTILQAYGNQDYPFDLMVDKYIKQRDISRNPFFDTMVNFHWENDLQHGVQPGTQKFEELGIKMKPVQFENKNVFQSVLDFKLDVEPIGNALNLNLSYNTLLFSAERMQAFLNEYVELLSSLIDKQNKSLDEYLKRSVEEKETALHENGLLPSVFNVNICASFVAEPLQEYIGHWSEELSLNLQTNFAPYNQVFQQLLNPNSLLYKNKGMNVLFIRVEDWLRDQATKTTEEQIALLNQTYTEFADAIQFANKNTFTPFLISIIPLQPSHKFPPTVVNEIVQINSRLEVLFKELPRFYLMDAEKIADLYGIEELFDARSDELGHIPFTQEYYAALGTFICRKIRAFKGPSSKVIVLDCDNTLWKGVCGEVGATNVIIDEHYTYLQEFLLQKYNEGYLLALCSKNNEEDVWEVFDNHPGMKINREHIAAHRINWNPKPGNVVEIAKDLNLGIKSFVFIDDSEFEVEQMTLGCADVLSLALPEDANDFEGFLNHIWALDYFEITEEDAKRNSMYKAEKQRQNEQVKYGSFNDFLQSLNIKVTLHALEEKHLDRAVQLTQRTNQFNLNGIKKTPDEIARLIGQPGHINWVIEVKDRFGDYGITGLLLARQSQKSLVIETFLLSCRVLGRNVEDFVLAELRNYCICHGLQTIIALFQTTNQNKPFINFLRNAEWVQDGNTNTYSLLIKHSEEEILLT